MSSENPRPWPQTLQVGASGVKYISLSHDEAVRWMGHPADRATKVERIKIGCAFIHAPSGTPKFIP